MQSKVQSNKDSFIQNEMIHEILKVFSNSSYFFKISQLKSVNAKKNKILKNKFVLNVVR